MTFQTRGLASANGQQVRHIYSSGLGADARVLTLAGEKPIKDLKAGERLVSADIGVIRLRAISKKTMHLQDMIKIVPNALWQDGDTGGFHVAPNQPVVLRGWMAKAMFGKSQLLVSARRLLDGQVYRRSEDPGTMTLYQLHFDQRHLVRVNGVDMTSTPLSALKSHIGETVRHRTGH
ncbi:Hint domain-containing protein [Aliiroseovarius crassostreae]|uniref:Hint domain-containing protein n=1 Tax=Aliiroseovarius crassostreae TaxID=154981 RepID=UPI003C7D1D3C